MKKELLVFSPLLLLYVVIVALFAAPIFEGDEVRYLNYAHNFSQGFFIDSTESIKIDAGPGYPLFLMPWVALGFPHIVLKFMNVLLGFIGIWACYRTLLFYLTFRKALIVSYVLGLYPPLLRWMITLHSELLSFMLVAVGMYLFTAMMRENKFHLLYYIPIVLVLGFLLLTKVLFSTVILLLVCLLVGAWLFSRHQRYAISLAVAMGAFLIYTPFLAYTYSLTGKFFYSGTQGGEVLYHRASPFEGEYGNWFTADDIYQIERPHKKKDLYHDLTPLIQNHQPFYDLLEGLNPVQRDSAFKAQAIVYVKGHPFKYLKNTLANIGRLFFHYPFSYRNQGMQTWGYMLPNMFLVVLILFSVYPVVRARKRMPYVVVAPVVFILLYLGGICALGGRGRHLIPAMPVLVLYLSFVYEHLIRISFRPAPKTA